MPSSCVFGQLNGFRKGAFFTPVPNGRTRNSEIGADLREAVKLYGKFYVGDLLILHDLSSERWMSLRRPVRHNMEMDYLYQFDWKIFQATADVRCLPANKSLNFWALERR